MPKFTSESSALVLQDDDGIWAKFRDGQFETDDKDIAARLRKVPGVSEVKGKAKPDADEPPADEPNPDA